jgi:hypothetical protein
MLVEVAKSEHSQKGEAIESGSLIEHVESSLGGLTMYDEDGEP